MSTPSPNDTYTSPLASRNASPEMLRIWSPRHKFNTWRRIWLAVAEAQYEVTRAWDAPLVTAEQLEALRKVVERGITDEELARAAELERDLRHDVMAHVHCLGESCPEAKSIIHLGCTSQDVVCNADLTSQFLAYELIEAKLDRVTHALGEFAYQWRDVPTLGFTHYQSAQPLTIGRRGAQWAYDLNIPEDWLFTARANYLRGMKGATGTQASFFKLFNEDSDLLAHFESAFLDSFGTLAGMPGFRFDGWVSSDDSINRIYRRKLFQARDNGVDADRIAEIESERDAELSEPIASRERRAHSEHAVRATYSLTGQTYPRVQDGLVLSHLATIASVLHKIATDIRLLSNRKEIDEPFGSKQIGSSAMPYKRNPMKCERICGLTRFVMNLVGNAYDTAATQWLERTLDDSSNRRLSLPEAFLALDGALDLMHQVASGLVVHEAMVRKNLMAELPFLATENILMEAVKAGGDRQDLHEKIRVHAQAAGMRVKQEGLDNDLIDRLRADPAFESVHHLLTEGELLDPMKYVGRSVEQTERFVKEVVERLRERYANGLDELGASDRGV